MFHSDLGEENSVATLRSMLSKMYLITPNRPEYEQLYHWLDEPDLSQKLGLEEPAVLLKGGHQQGNDCSDFLYTKNKIISVEGARIPGFR